MINELNFSIFHIHRILQEQTEKSLIDYQNRLVQTENDLAQTACEQGAMDAKFLFTNKTINNLKDEAAKLKSIIELLEKDRAEMHVRPGFAFYFICELSHWQFSIFFLFFTFLESVGR